MGQWIFLAASFAVGALIPLQAAANSRLGVGLAQPLWSALVALSVSCLTVVAALIVTQTPTPTPNQAVSIPTWAWLGGVAGAAFVTAGAILVPKVGAAGFLVGTIAGQIIIAVAIDNNGWLGVTSVPLDVRRACALAMVLFGAILFGLEN